MRKKKREFVASELVKTFAQNHQFEDKLFAFEIKVFLQSLPRSGLQGEIERISIREGSLLLKLRSPLLRHELRMRKSQYLGILQEKYGKEKIAELLIF